MGNKVSTDAESGVRVCVRACVHTMKSVETNLMDSFVFETAN